MAARRRESGRDEGLAETVVDGWNGNGAGSGQDSTPSMKVRGVGMTRFPVVS